MATRTGRRRHSFHHGDLRDAAIDVAFDVIVEEGVDALKLRAVASKCGVDHTALYRHFKDKDGLVLEVIIKGFRQLNDALSRPEGLSFGDVLVGYARFAIKNPNLYLAMFSHSSRRSFDDEKLTDEIRHLTHRAAACLDPRLVDKHKIPKDARDRVIEGWALAHGLIDLWHRRMLVFQNADQAEAFVFSRLKRAAKRI